MTQYKEKYTIIFKTIYELYSRKLINQEERKQLKTYTAQNGDQIYDMVVNFKGCIVQLKNELLELIREDINETEESQASSESSDQTPDTEHFIDQLICENKSRIINISKQKSIDTNLSVTNEVAQKLKRFGSQSTEYDNLFAQTNDQSIVQNCVHNNYKKNFTSIIQNNNSCDINNLSLLSSDQQDSLEMINLQRKDKLVRRKTFARLSINLSPLKNNIINAKRSSIDCNLQQASQIRQSIQILQEEQKQKIIV